MEKKEIRYKALADENLVKEQPFYRKGMSNAEVQRELEYLNRNLPSFYDGSYMPLWKQGWFR
ncbi:MAG: hypothetical protein ACI4EK_03670 [Wujia sp.]